jgi:hypothetical protein
VEVTNELTLVYLPEFNLCNSRFELWNKLTNCVSAAVPAPQQ